MTYAEWEAGVPDVIREDSLWKMEAYRLGLFLADLAWHDATRLAADPRTVGIADQLFRAAGKISSNVGEGYSRGTGRDRARFYEYALGSSREARDWYFKGRHVLEESVVAHRMDLASQITRLTVVMAARERRVGRKFSEE
ncbi:MAG TPA: four helix bundle protein [Tepidisphaeraceae bacterium]|jgi:four helix bundle protein|nr:four helix bundle protein [Tepidisphaeraceae bacterium]